MAAPWVSAAIILFNVVPSVLLIMTNKYLVTHHGFTFMMSLTTVHMLTLWVLMHALRKFGVFVSKKMDNRNIFFLTLTGVGSIAFMNLNLSLNSVGFYQLSKLACVPCTVTLQVVVWGEKFPSTHVFLSLVVLLVGIAFATVTDVEINLLGSCIAIMAVVTTTLYQIWIGSKQRELQMNQFQMLYQLGPYMSLFSAVLIPLFDCTPLVGSNLLSEFVWTVPVVKLIFLTCVAAVGVNVSTYLLIKTTSPLTYLVVGHAKTLLILCSGFLLFGKTMSAGNLGAVAIAFVGVLMYTYCKHQAANETKVAAYSPQTATSSGMTPLVGSGSKNWHDSPARNINRDHLDAVAEVGGDVEMGSTKHL